MKRTVLVSLMLSSVGAISAAPAPVENITTDHATDRVSRLERMVKAKQQADFESQRQLNTLQQEVLDLRGLVEQQNYQLKQILERQRQLYDEIAQLSLQNSAVAVTPTTASPLTGSIDSTPSSLNETASYQQALDLVRKQRQYDEAITAFKNFIAQYPNSTLIANANYWLGQLLYNKEDYSEAKVAFSNVADRYKQSNKRADSLLKLGLIAEKTGDKVSAKSFYRQVQQEYSDSSSARIAGQQLTAMKG